MKKRNSTRTGFLASAALATSLSFSSSPALADSQPSLGDMMPVGFNFCPRGWAAADGQLLAINQNQSLYSLLGTTFGGDGRTTFALPDLRGRAPVRAGTGSPIGTLTLGQRGGSTTATMTINTMPAHSHLVNATNEQGDKKGPGGDLLADANTEDPNTDVFPYHDGPPNRVMKNTMLSNTGGGQAFSVMDPYLAVNWCIALQGLFPSRN